MKPNKSIFQERLITFCGRFGLSRINSWWQLKRKSGLLQQLHVLYFMQQHHPKFIDYCFVSDVSLFQNDLVSSWLFVLHGTLLPGSWNTFIPVVELPWGQGHHPWGHWRWRLSTQTSEFRTEAVHVEIRNMKTHTILCKNEICVFEPFQELH